jgi:hypothetical protein
MWQDWVISGCQGGMVLALLPSVWRGTTVPLTTCFVTTACLLLMSWPLFAAGFTWSSGTALVAGAEWVIISTDNVRQLIEML